MRKYISLLVLLWSVGCSGLLTSRKPLDPDVNPASVLSGVYHNFEKVKTFSGKGIMTVSAVEGSHRATLNVRIKQPDSLWFKIEGPLGLDLATGRMSSEKAEIFVGLENILYTGPIVRLGELNLLPVDLDLSGLLLLFLGLADPSMTEMDSVTSIDVAGRKYRFDFGAQDILYIEPDINAVTRWEKFGLNGEITAKIETGEYRKVKNVYMPRLIKMTGYNPKQRLTIFYERLDPNIKLKDNWFEIKIPEGVQIVNL